MKEESMEETASWKGHSFTLLVFGGIVALCSIFFVLGMLVGRSQGQRMAEMASADTDAKKQIEASAAKADLKILGTPESSPFNDEEAAATGNDIKAKPAPEAPKPPVSPAPAPTTSTTAATASKAATKTPAKPAAKPAAEPSTKIYLQVAAVRQLKDAQRELQNVKSKGFPSALILSPSAGDSSPFYRVQVGPYATDAEAAAARRQLESKGFKQVLVKK
jgi:cell division septation protein DedD